MRLIDLLEKNKENLLTELAASKVPEKAVRVMENELDRLLMMYNEQCGSEKERETAAYIMQAVRLSLPLIDSCGEMKVWETQSASQSKSRLNPLAILFVIAGAVLCGLGLLPLIVGIQDAGKDPDLLKIAAMELGGLAAAFLGGLLARGSGQKAPKRTHRVETQIDPNRIYRNFRNVILSADQNLDEIRSLERRSRQEGAGLINARGASSAELELFSDLLAAAYSKDPDFAMEKMEEIRYYLHRQEIEVVDYSRETEQFFDMMPGQFAGTIRPALVSDGTVLRKGIASRGSK